MASFPSPTTGTDIQSWDFLRPHWEAVQERYWANSDSPTSSNVPTGFPFLQPWPKDNFYWEEQYVQNGNKVSSIVDNGDGTYTITDSGAAFPVNRFAGYTAPACQSYVPSDYDIFFDFILDATKCVTCPILSNTATTITFDGGNLKDMIVGGWLSAYTDLNGAYYHCIKRNGVTWASRWLVWPNDREQWVGSSLAAGALQPVTSLTSSGTTATAIVTGHGFATGDSVTIAGATPSGYNGTFTITVVDANTFTFTVGGGLASPATGTITAKNQYVGAHDSSATYPVNAFAGMDLMVKGSDGRLKRISITGNDATNLFFAKQTYTVSGAYGIVNAGKRWRFYPTSDTNPYSSPAFRWYHPTVTSSYFSHDPNDAVSATKAPAATLGGLFKNIGTDCSPNCQPDSTNFQVFDNDYWTDYRDFCNTPDHPYSVDIFRTIHGLQVAIEALVANQDSTKGFVKAQSYETAASIPVLRPATLFEAAGINSQRGTTGSTDGTGINVSALTLPFTPIEVYFATLNTDGSVNHFGTCVADSSTHLTNGSPGFSVSDESSTIVISLGWTRKYPNEFMYLYPRWTFIPNVDGTPAIVYPPTGSPSANVGKWVYRAPSTKYKEARVETEGYHTGHIHDSNGYRPFVTNDYARYSGDNFNDPTIYPEIVSPDGATPTLENFYTYAYEGVLSPTNQATLQASMSGTTTGGWTGSGLSALQDISKNWFLPIVPGGANASGIGHTESGTANGFSNANFLDDTTKAGNAFWNAIGRHLDTDGVTDLGYRDFVIQVTIGGTEYRRVITTYDPVTPRCTFDSPLPASSFGATYQIREPQILNRWKGRTVTITEPNGTVHADIPILYSDDCTLYFAPQSFTVGAVWSYAITEHQTGGVWKWNGTAWVKPTGTDARGGQPWHDNQTENLPTYQIGYGKMMKGDYITPTLFTEIQAALSALVYTKRQGSWIAQGEQNENKPPVWGKAEGAPSHTGAMNGFTGCVPGAFPVCGAKNLYSGNYYLTSADQAPYCFSYADNGTCSAGHCGCYDYQVGRRYAYQTRQFFPYAQWSGVDWYVYATAVESGAGGGASAHDRDQNCPPAPNGSAQNHIFDNNGDTSYYHQWRLYESDAPDNSITRTSAKFGSLNMPDDCPDPDPSPSDSSYCQQWEGYYIADQCLVLKFNNVAGFRWY